MHQRCLTIRGFPIRVDDLHLASCGLQGQCPSGGLIDEAEIYDRALSAAEIKAIFNAGSAGKCKP